jgi:spore coat polysaccharide biosynthesis predicted glycosyltransferase SpsG
MTYSNVCIVTEGGGDRGLGHVYRSITLAAQLPGSYISLPLTVGAEARALVTSSGLADGPRNAWPSPADVLIRDIPMGYSVGRGALLTVDICDDIAESSGTADVTFAFLGTKEANAHVSDHAAGKYYGLRYAILRQEFADPVPYAQRDKDTITICLGGVDPSHATDAIASAIQPIVAESAGCERVQVIKGPGNEPSTGTLDRDREPVTPTPVKQLPVWQALSRSRLAIVSPGSTLLECAAMGVPALVVSHNEREHNRVMNMMRAGCDWFDYSGGASDFLGFYLDRVTELVASNVAYYIDPPNVCALNAMSTAGSRSLDGCGAWRVGGALRRRIHELNASAPAPAVQFHGNEDEDTSLGGWVGND